jgi:hypothetical protein
MSGIGVPVGLPWRAVEMTNLVGDRSYVATEYGGVVVSGPMPLWLARLIAAAPEMYEALRASLPPIEAMQRIALTWPEAKGCIAGGPIDTAIRAAIAKAEGRS